MNYPVATYVAAAVVGLSLGLFGAGGSILTLPVLVYFAGVSPVLGTAYSLFVVGFTALLAAANYLRLGLVDRGALLAFGVPSLVAVFLARLYLLPSIPDPVVRWGEWFVGKDELVMMAFAVMMVVAGVSMIRARRDDVRPGEATQPRRSFLLAAVEGVLVGLVTGLVGAGGGFVIVPVLAIRWGLPIRLAIGTSLAIIAAKSLIGFLGDVQLARQIEWSFLIRFTAVVCLGMLVGVAVNRRVTIATLRGGFGWFVLLAAAVIVAIELCT
ncbi:MAG: sulfite exporter TauE/SafE family protein [Planctomycetota bacterium]|nr:MAG: sulfite exporter TauE/SafE family protein [Planctomycetota bacterium]REK25116.1 MAG: sulfite exporter TauE/SafE family protein [Planctomycetota bacterium]